MGRLVTYLAGATQAEDWLTFFGAKVCVFQWCSA